MNKPRKKQDRWVPFFTVIGPNLSPYIDQHFQVMLSPKCTVYRKGNELGIRAEMRSKRFMIPFYSIYVEVTSPLEPIYAPLAPKPIKGIIINNKFKRLFPRPILPF